MTVIGPIGFTGGLNLASSSINLPKNQMTDAQNVFIKYNDLVKANGSTKINTTGVITGASKGMTGMFQFRTTTSYLFLEATTSGNAQNFKYSTSLASSLTAITDSIGLSNPSPHYCVFNNLLIRVGDSTTAKWVGPGNNIVALGGSPPAGTICAVANNFVFIASGSRLYWSNVGDPETWTVGNFIDFRVNDGDTIQGLSSFNQNILIWKKNSIGQLFTTTTFVAGATVLSPLTTITVGKGLCYRLAWDYVNQVNICFVASNNHIYIFDGANFVDISDPAYPTSNIQPYLDSIKIAGTNPIVVNYPTRNQIWISTADGSSSISAATHNIILIYNYQIGVWESKITGRNAQSMIQYINYGTADGGTYPVTIISGDVNTIAYQQDVGAINPEDPNGAIDGYGLCSIEIAQNEGDFKLANALVPMEAEGNWNLEFNYGFNSTSVVNKSVLLNLSLTGSLLDSFILDSGVLGGNNLLRKPIAIASDNTTSSVQIQFRNRNSSQPFVVHPFYLSDTEMR